MVLSLNYRCHVGLEVVECCAGERSLAAVNVVQSMKATALININLFMKQLLRGCSTVVDQGVH